MVDIDMSNKSHPSDSKLDDNIKSHKAYSLRGILAVPAREKAMSQGLKVDEDSFGPSRFKTTRSWVFSESSVWIIGTRQTGSKCSVSK